MILKLDILDSVDAGHVVCPECSGGLSGERSFVVFSNDDGGIGYKCYRASCGFSGRLMTPSGGRVSPAGRKKNYHPYDGELTKLNEEWVEYLKTKIGWGEEHIWRGNPLYAEDNDRIAYPIYSPLRERRGLILRSYATGVNPKVLTHMEVDAPHLSWYRHHGYGRVVVVEDIPSAVRASFYANSVALCGTGCSEEYVTEIASNASRVIWALDADAMDKSFALCKKFTLFFNRSQVLPLEKDLKNMEENALGTLLSQDFIR